MYVVYRHIRLDKNQPFYIGIGERKRAYSKLGRNKIWKRIVNKTDYEVEILFEDLTWEQACEKEIEFIQLYGRIDLQTGILCNLTDGGDGIINPSEELRHKRRIKMLGNTVRKGFPSPNKGKKASEEAKRKMSENTARAMSKKVIDNSNGKIYKSITEASTFLNIKQRNLARYLRGDRKNITTLSFLEPKKDFGYKIGKKVSDEVRNKISNKLKKSISVIFLDTNEKKIYESQKDCCEELDIKRASLNVAISRGHTCMTKFGKIKANKI